MVFSSKAGLLRTSAAGGLLVSSLCSAAASGLELELKESVVLPTEEALSLPQALSLIEGTGVVLAITSRKAEGAGPVLSTVWRVEGGEARRILGEARDERLQGCTPRSDREALCLFLSAKGALTSAILNLADDTLAGQKVVGSIRFDALEGLVATEDGDTLLWGMSELQPFAVRLDQDGEQEWAIRWGDFEIGDFYDAVETAKGAVLLARSRTENGGTGGKGAVIEVSAGGEVLASRSFSRSDAKTLPLLEASSADGAPSGTARIAGGEAVSPADAGLRTDLPLGSGLLPWVRLDVETVAYLSLEGTEAVLVVSGRGGSEVAKAPVAGLPFSARVIGLDDTVYVFTADMEPGHPPRQMLRVSRYELEP